MDTILTTKNLCKNFKKQKANDNISITVRKNSIYGLLGPNGAGKSTFLKMIAGMITPSSGEIYFDEKVWERKHLIKIGAFIESPPIYENLTAFENLKVRALLYNLP
ncbi:MAG: ATP-binding cassette domain-containing protein, partial [Acetivibrio sp.]